MKRPVPKKAYQAPPFLVLLAALKLIGLSSSHVASPYSLLGAPGQATPTGAGG